MLFLAKLDSDGAPIVTTGAMLSSVYSCSRPAMCGHGWQVTAPPLVVTVESSMVAIVFTFDPRRVRSAN